ncbi:MAG: hypothetical protein ACK4FJ_12205 [Ferrovibrio sp.]|uniref:hypothetical protein n=1 Tax=Ferrovibrio sp. TaxID=1917215 RepID=UPI00391DC273
MVEQNNVPPVASKLTLPLAVAMAWFFSINPHDSNWRELYISKNSASSDGIDASRGALVFESWPLELQHWLKLALPFHVGCSKQDAERILYRLRTTFQKIEGADLLFVEVRKYLDRTDGRLPLRNGAFFGLSDDAKRLMPAAMAARFLKVRPERISSLWSSGALKGQSTMRGARRLTFIEKSSLENGSSEQLTSKEGAAALLGISIHQVALLVKDGFLKVKCGIHGVGMITDESLEKLCSNTKSICIPRNSNSNLDVMPVSEVTALRHQRIASVVQHILSGQIAAFHVPACVPIFRQIYVKKSDVLQLRRSEGEPAALSVRDVSKRLGLAVRMVPILVRAGCLQAKLSSGGELEKRSVLESSVAAFHSNYIMTAGIATKLKTSTKTVMRIARNAGVVPVVSSSSILGISAVWRLSVIKNIR